MIRFSILAALALALLAQAQPAGRAEAQYHVGARAYVDGDDARALQAVEAGLEAAPDDPKLQALRDLIQQDQEQEQDDRDGGQQSPDQQNADPGEDGEQGDPGEGEQEPEPPENEDGQEAERDQTQTAPPQNPQAGDQSPQASRAPEEMTRAQAERILDAVGGEERLLLRELRRAPTQRRRSDKDW